MKTLQDRFYQQNQELFNIVIRISKEDSVFVYNLLESHENICMYSTLDQSLKQPYRDIDIKGTPEFQKDVDHIIERCGEMFPLEIIKFQILQDKKSSL